MRYLMLAIGMTSLLGCATVAMEPPGVVDPATGAPAATAPATDLFDALSSNPLLDVTTADADKTLAWVTENEATLGSVKAELARACPRAVKFAVADLRAKLALLKSRFADLQAAPPEGTGGPTVIFFLTRLKYGTQPDLRTEVDGIKADIGLRIDALTTGCGHLVPARQMNALLKTAAKAGLITTGGPAALGVLGVLP